MTNSQCKVAGSSGQALIRSVRPVFTSARCTRAEGRGQSDAAGPDRQQTGASILVRTQGRVGDSRVLPDDSVSRSGRAAASDVGGASLPACGNPRSPSGGGRRHPQRGTCASAVSSPRPRDVAHTRRSQLDRPSVPSEMYGSTSRVRATDEISPPMTVRAMG